MKTILSQNCSRVALAALLLAASVAAGRADIVYYQNTFDDSSSLQAGTPNYNPPPISMIFAYGTTTAGANNSVAWVTNDAANSLTSGSAKLGWIWSTNDPSGGAVFQVEVFPNQTSNFTAIAFDIMVDPSSTPDIYNGYGYFQVALLDNSYSENDSGFNQELANPGYSGTASPGAGVWQHINIPLSGAAQTIRALRFKDYNDVGVGSRNINGPVTIYIDNLTLYQAGVTVPPTNYISPAGTKGLYMLTTVNSTPDAPQYQRQGIRTADFKYNWVGSGANPVTYALTIASFPPSAHSNFEAYMFLIPTNTLQGGPTEPNADYPEPNVIMFSIQNHADGTTSGQLVSKFGVYNSSTYDSWGSVSSPSALGTWSITFSNDDDFTLSAPGGATFSTNFPGGTATGNSFGDPLCVYIGTRPNDTNNTGQQNIFSQFQVISNGVPLLNETFSTPTLSPTWAMAAEDLAGMLQVPPSTAYLLTWTLPDAGFNLQVTTNLSSSGAWHDPGLTKTLFNGKRTVLIPSTMVATNKPGMFRLIKP